MSRTVVLIGGGVIVILLIVIALLVGILLGRGSNEQTREPDNTTASTYEVTQEPTQDEHTQPTTTAPKQEESSSSTTDAGLTFSGEGDQSTRPFELDEGLRVFEATFEAQGETTNTYFGVRLISDDPDFPEVTVQGLRPGLIFNELAKQGDTFEGSKPVRVSESGTYVLQVDGEGPWTITIT